MMEERGGSAAEFRVPANWDGPVGMSIGGELYIDLSGDVHADAIGEKVDELVATILRLNDHHCHHGLVRTRSSSSGEALARSP